MVQVRKRKFSLSPESLLEGLNPEQRAVVTAGEGAQLVLAGAGAGKTKALVHRIAMLNLMGTGAREILAVTFSKKAADEMNLRLKAIGIESAKVGTWHALAYQILREERREMVDWDLDEREQFKFLVKDVLGWQGMKWDTADLTVVMSYIGLCKARCAEPASAAAEAEAEKLFAANPCNQTTPRLLAQAYSEATDAQMQRRLITFDDQLLWTWRILKDSEEARARWSGRFKWILQDEAQDSNPVQTDIAEMLARPHGNYMMVGDPAQSIFGFRGSSPEKFTSFEKDWAPVTVIRMNRNYRSGAEVIEAANRLTASMAEGTHLGVGMIAERGTHAKIEVIEADSMDDEGEGVAIDFLSHHASGTPWRDMACLYRTNAQSRGVEEACLRNRIPYVVIGGTNFYDRREVKDLLAYLRLAARGHATHLDDVKRCMNAPFRYLGKVFQNHVEADNYDGEDWVVTALRVATKSGLQERQRRNVREWADIVESVRRSIEILDRLQAQRDPSGDVLRSHPNKVPMDPTADARPHMPAAILERIIRDTDYMKYITKDEGAETVENNRVSNVRELVRAAERFTSVAELLEYIDTTTRAAKAAKDDASADRVTLCSLHRSKGLEWPVVCIIGANDKILPHARSTDIEEERRLFYVGITRARDNLRISHVRSAAFGARVVAMEPSPFLREAGLGGAPPSGEPDLSPSFPVLEA